MAKQEWEVVKSNFQKWNKIGDHVEGTYVKKEYRMSTLPGKENTKQTIYTLIKDDGSEVKIGGRGQENPTIMPGIENSRLGEYLQVIYEGDGKAKAAGFTAPKYVNVKTRGEMRLDVLKKYRDDHQSPVTDVSGPGEMDIPFGN